MSFVLDKAGLHSYQNSDKMIILFSTQYNIKNAAFRRRSAVSSRLGLLWAFCQFKNEHQARKCCVKVLIQGNMVDAREVQAVFMKVVTSSSVASPKLCGGPNTLTLMRAAVICSGHCLSKHKMTRYTRNSRDVVPLPSWLRLWLQEKNDKETTVHSLPDIQSSTNKKLAKTQDSQTLQNPDEKRYDAFGCYQLDCPQTEISCWNSIHQGCRTYLLLRATLSVTAE